MFFSGRRFIWFWKHIKLWLNFSSFVVEKKVKIHHSTLKTKTHTRVLVLFYILCWYTLFVCTHPIWKIIIILVIVIGYELFVRRWESITKRMFCVMLNMISVFYYYRVLSIISNSSIKPSAQRLNDSLHGICSSLTDLWGSLWALDSPPSDTSLFMF